jgi:DMSO reductase anchor subunit
MMSLGGVFLLASRAWSAAVALFVIAVALVILGEVFERWASRHPD